MDTTTILHAMEKMEIFIIWHGQRGNAVAAALEEWLPQIVNAFPVKSSRPYKGSVRPELLFTTMRENGGSNMPVALPEPDGEREGIPLWLCPNCDQLKPLQDYGWKKRNDICPGQQVWFKQGWCNRCLQALVKSVEVS